MRYKTILLWYYFLLITCLPAAVQAVPINIHKTKVQNTEPVESAKIQPSDTGLYYNEYLKQIIDVLETNISEKSFRKQTKRK